jgi:class 3 adenylate cyclase/tetratricopeptide (TPR) repeat protein
MQCPRCGNTNVNTDAFCGACGIPLGPTCTECGHANRPGHHFCGRCGRPLSQIVSYSQSSDQLLRALSISGGERKRLTVLFADICNSTGLIGYIDPESAVRRVSPVLDLMREAVHRYDGVVNKVQGDGIMALFGAPRPHEDHCVRGCLAALAMQEAVNRLNDTDLRIRVGLHTGEVVVQAVENSLNQTYDAAGAAVHLANRMEQMADGGTIVLTAETFNGARQFIDVQSLGPRVARGLSTPVEVFQLIGLKHAPASERFRSGPRPSPLYGRTRELAALDLELTSTMRGEGRAVGIVGEAGLGKSRLCFEFAETCRRRGIRVVEARVLAHGKATPLQPVLELLRDAFNIQNREGPETSRRRVIDLLRSRGDFSEALPVLLHFLGIPDPAERVPTLDPVARKIRLLNFVRQFIHSRPPDEVVLVLVEDLHWIDQASEEFVETLIDAIVGTKTLLLMNFRPGFAAPWVQRTHYRQINLAPLESSESTQLLRAQLGDDPSLVLLRRGIEERAQGNPFFLEELVNSLVERGDFQGERGAYRLKGGIDTLPLPSTVQAVLSARVDRLEEAPRQILQTAAVVGREVPVAILQRVSGFPTSTIANALWQLRKAELLYELPAPKQGVHAFRHPLIQEVVYGSLLHERRRRLHGLVAHAIQDHFKGHAEETAGLLGYHLEQAGELLQAAQANARSAIWIGANDAGQALRTWTKVRELLITQTPSQTTDYLRMMACGQIVNFGWREGISPEEAGEYFEEAKQLALASGNMRANALIHAGYGRVLAASGSADEYVGKIREAEALARNSNDPSLQVTLKAVLCHALRLAGCMVDALAANTEAINRVCDIGEFDRQMLGFDLEAWLSVMRGQILIILGRGDEARPYLDKVIEMRTNQIDVTNHVAPSVAYVDLAWAEHDARLAAQHAERAFSLAVNSGNPYVRVYAQACRGLSHIVAGKYDAAIVDLEEALAFAIRRKAGLENQARILADLANAYRLKGEFPAASRTATEAIAVATARRSRLPECLARIVLGHALCATVKDDERVALELRQAQSLVKETGGVIYESLIRSLRTKLDHGARNSLETPSRLQATEN